MKLDKVKFFQEVPRGLSGEKKQMAHRKTVSEEEASYFQSFDTLPV